MEANGGRIRVLVFASGDEKGGGSGFQELVEFSRTNPPVVDAQIVGVISNHHNGGVRRRADALHIPLSIGPDHLMLEVTGHSSPNIRLTSSCAPGG